MSRSSGEPAIELDGLVKSFEVPEREAGLAAAVRSLVRRRTRTVTAVGGVSLTVQPGEVVGFLGPNGAGKTTTLKVLSGLLFPTSGRVAVLGFEPQRRQREFLRSIALVMGNRNQLQWDIPASDSFELNRAIYQIPAQQFRRTRDELIDLLEVGDLVRKPVRTLSLGERMKVEIVGSLLHRPSVLFLDEPTIGLDVIMQKRIRAFLADYNLRYGATVVLTSHYMADVQALARRVVVIHHGRLRFDGQLSQLAHEFAAYQTIQLTLEVPADLSRYGEVMVQDGQQVTLRVPQSQTARLTAALLAEHAVLDLTVQDPPIDDVIESVFAEEPGPAGDPVAP